MPRDDLLRPSLTDTSLRSTPYPVRVTFLTSFFGGPFAALLILGANSYRLNRLARDAVPITLMVAIYIALVALLASPEWGAQAREQIVAFGGKRGLVLANRLIGLVFFGAGVALHRKEQRAADLMGSDPPNGWIGGLATIAAGLVLTIALAVVFPEAFQR